MNVPFVDTDVLIRLLTGDDPAKQAAAKALFERVEQGTLDLAAPVTVIADAVYVLSSARLYHLPRAQVAALLIPLVRLPHFHVKNRRTILRALELYATTALDFGDVLIIASMEHAHSTHVFSYDQGFDRVASAVGIIREEP